MHWIKRLVFLAATPVAFALTISAVRAADTATPAPAAPAPESTPTLMDRAYDGNTHVTLTPYLWLPTVRTNLQFTVPKLPNGGGTFEKNTQVGPSDYLSNINSGAEFNFTVRKGEMSLIGDYIYMNASATSTSHATLSGPIGKLHIPATFVTNSRLAVSIWELAGAFSLAHGHNADVNLLVGWRQSPLTVNSSYNATIGSRVQLTRNGSVRVAPVTNDVVFGFQGKAFLGDGHWFAPYYVDMGVGALEQTWQANGGVGYAFPHGQAFVATFRTLQYNGFSSNSPVQKLSMWGPLLGYSFGL